MSPINPITRERQGYVAQATSPCKADQDKWYAYRLEPCDNGSLPSWRYAGCYRTQHDAERAAGLTTYEEWVGIA